MRPREEALERAGYACEAMVMTAFRRWVRCGMKNVEVHHALTRARGGALLDSVGESYHLIVLCQQHHRGADGDDAYEGDLLIDGYCVTEKGRVVYHGSDDFLKEKYPREEDRGTQRSITAGPHHPHGV